MIIKELLKIKLNHWMTVQVDSQPMTDQIMWYIDMCFINNSIYCYKKKTTFRTHEQTCYVNFNVCQKWTVRLSPHPCLYLLNSNDRSLWVDFQLLLLFQRLVMLLLHVEDPVIENYWQNYYKMGNLTQITKLCDHIRIFEYF